MAKKGNDMICTNECVECIYSDLDANNIALKFHCNAKNKDYIYGQYVPCEFKELRSNETTV